MKIDMPQTFVPFGPVGHPGACAHTRYLGHYQDEVLRKFFDHMCRWRAQGLVPSVFFRGEKTLEEQGYYILEVVNGEIPDDVIAALKPAVLFTKPNAHESGRKIESIREVLPSHTDLENVEVWEAGHADCDHDFGLETWEVKYQTEKGEILDEEEAHLTDARGTFFYTVRCTRCNAVHAYPEKD